MPSDEALQAAKEAIGEIAGRCVDGTCANWRTGKEDVEEVAEIIDRHMPKRAEDPHGPYCTEANCACFRNGWHHALFDHCKTGLRVLLVEAAEMIDGFVQGPYWLPARQMAARLRRAAEEMK